MSTKTVKQPSFLKPSKPAAIEEDVVGEEQIEELPAFINVINKSSANILLESGKVKPNDEGVATRAEYQNLHYLFERVD